jgi:hypothetical protein
MRAAPEAPDFSMIGEAQLVQLCLQRSNRLKRIIPSRAKHGDAWPGKMRKAVAAHRAEILDAVFAELSEVFAELAPAMDAVAPKSLADIGCGQAFIDLLVWRRYGCRLILVDIESSQDLHFGFSREGAGYADLGSARAFLVANGVPDAAITTLNPRAAPVAGIGQVDMALSLISCGFHYPVETYDAFFRAQVDRAILLDCRTGTGGEAALAAYGPVERIGGGKRHDRLLCRTG